MSTATPQSKTFFSKEAISGLPWMIISKLILFFVYFGISVIIVRFLGAEQYGVFSLCKNISEYLIPICGLGLPAAILRFVPELSDSTNLAGIKRLITKSVLLQLAAIVFAIGTLTVFSNQLSQLFKIDFKNYLFLTGLLVGAQVLKNTLRSSLTAFLKAKILAGLSLVQGIMFVGGLYCFLRLHPDVGTTLTVEIVSLAVIIAIAGGILIRHLKSLNWRSPPYSVGKRRTLKLSGAVLLNSVFRMIMLKYTEIFFLGVYFTPVVVGSYELGYSMPQMVVAFIPTAIQALFISAFSAAYNQDESCLGMLVSSLHKIIILMSVPLTAFGVFFAGRAVILVYGAEMSAAAPVARAFCLFHMFPLISMPLSIALTAKEKILNMAPFLIMQVVVNIILDYLLIPTYGMNGAMWAVFGTFALTIPIRLYKVHSLIGGIFFPFRFFLKMSIPLFVLAFAFSPLSELLNLPMLFALALLYGLLYLVVIKMFGLLSAEDVREFENLDIALLTKVLKYMKRK